MSYIVFISHSLHWRYIKTALQEYVIIMNERLVKCLNENSIMNHNQTGFRKGFRTSDHVFVLNTILNSYFSHNKPVYACFVEFSKAYDSVWRTALFYKLIVNQVNCRFIKLIQSMYSGLQSVVKLSYGITPFFKSVIGVRQGCSLSPTLFNSFLNDLPEIFYSKCDPIRIWIELLIVCRWFINIIRNRNWAYGKYQ